MMLTSKMPLKMVYVGSLGTSPDRDSGWIREFSNLGWVVLKFNTNIEIYGNVLIKKIKRRIQLSGEYIKLEQSLLNLVESERPCWVHFRLPTEFGKSTIRRIKSLNVIVTQYCNDDAFSKKAPPGLYWKFRHALPYYDGHFVFRERNVREYFDAGVSHVEHCPPTFDPICHTLNQRFTDGRFIADATFVGHYENDGRLAYMEGLQRAGFKVILKGGMWDSALKNDPHAQLSPIPHAFGDEYNRLYANSIAGLCFFSKINNDEWTRRGPEIIAVGGLLVCERTSEAQRRFKDQEEAFFFSSVDELVEIVDFLKKQPQEREKVRAAGYERLMSGGYTLTDRARQISHFVSEKLQKHA